MRQAPALRAASVQANVSDPLCTLSAGRLVIIDCLPGIRPLVVGVLGLRVQMGQQGHVVLLAVLETRKCDGQSDAVFPVLLWICSSDERLTRNFKMEVSEDDFTECISTVSV